jgi:hypothetical protein|tara:strand:- start:82 stop:288 length:207 start_codon:yes stop_codon:yes gene_type:complete
MLSEYGRKQLMHLMIEAEVHTDKEVGDLAGVSQQTANNFRLGKPSSAETASAILSALIQRQKVAVSAT